MPTKDQFRSHVRSQLRSAELRGDAFAEINSGEVHRKLGGYPATNHQMRTCMMRNEQGHFVAPQKRARRFSHAPVCTPPLIINREFWRLMQ